jgi:hypothetical protein
VSVPLPSHPADLISAHGSASNDVWIGGTAETLLHWDGSAWKLVDIQLGGHDVSHLWAARPNDAWAMSDLGDVARWNGSSWNPDATATNPNWRAISGSGSDDVWLVGLAGAASHYDGANWSPVDTGILANLRAVWTAKPNDVWVVATSQDNTSQVVHYDGKSWTPWTSSFDTGEVPSQLWGTASNDVSLLTNASLWHWDGSSWSVVASIDSTQPPPSGGASTTRDETFVVGAAGRIYHRVGNDFEPMSTWVSSDDIAAIYAASESDVWFAGKNGAVIHWDGTQLKKMPAPTLDGGAAPDLLGVYSSGEISPNGAGGVWVVGAGGAWAWRPTTQTWEAAIHPHMVGHKLHGVWAPKRAASDTTTDRTIAWAVGEGPNGGAIYEWSTSTSSWLEQMPSDPLQGRTLNAIAGTSMGDIWAVGTVGTAVYFNGNVWFENDPNTTANLTTVACFTAGYAWAGGPNGQGDEVFELKLGEWSKLSPPQATHKCSGQPALWIGDGQIWLLGSCSTLNQFATGEWGEGQSIDGHFNALSGTLPTSNASGAILWLAGATGRIVHN